TTCFSTFIERASIEDPGQEPPQVRYNSGRKFLRLSVEKILRFLAPHPCNYGSDRKRGKLDIDPLESEQRPSLSDFELGGAIAETLLANSELIEQRQKQVRHRCMRREHQVPAALQRSRGAARDQHRQWIVIVLIPIAHAAAVQHDGMIEQI